CAWPTTGEPALQRHSSRPAALPSSVHTILYAPGMEEMALGIAALLEGATALCTTDLVSSSAPTFCAALCWEKFPSGDPNIKLRMSAVRNKHVILLMNHDTMYLFEQLAVLLQLQRFNVPKADKDLAARKWKQLGPEDYEMCSAKSVTVVTPWYRHCQMERTCRWRVTEERKWDNGDPNGEFVDVPTAQSFAAMLSISVTALLANHARKYFDDTSARPIRKRSRVMCQLLLIDIHEYEDLEKTLISTGRWSNREREYDYVHGTGTFFTSAFARYLSVVLYPSIDQSKDANQYVVFPDAGAHRRFYTMVETCIKLPLDHILWISKSRVARAALSLILTHSVQKNELFYLNSKGEERKLESLLPEQSTVRILAPSLWLLFLPELALHSPQPCWSRRDRVTYLQQWIALAKLRAPIVGVKVNAFVSHFVAKYDEETVKKFVDKLYQASLYHTTGTECRTISACLRHRMDPALTASHAQTPYRTWCIGFKLRVARARQAVTSATARGLRSLFVQRLETYLIASVIRRQVIATDSTYFSSYGSAEVKAGAAAGAIAGAIVGAAAALCVVALTIGRKA
ncbi:MAG: hypothetical protein SGPRY_011483, partial [Prymnesium sp.]